MAVVRWRCRQLLRRAREGLANPFVIPTKSAQIPDERPHRNTSPFEPGVRLFPTCVDMLGDQAPLVLPGLLPVRPLVFLAQPGGRRVLQDGG